VDGAVLYSLNLVPTDVMSRRTRVRFWGKTGSRQAQR
jgi:hypothetical protein